MHYNEILNQLKNWRLQKADEYHVKYAEAHGISYLYALTTSELTFKLMQFVDQDFSDNTDFYERMVTMTNMHYDPLLKKNFSRAEQYVIDKVHADFLSYAQQLLSGESPVTPLSQSHYERVITGDEADFIISQIYSHWEYSNTCYWFPLIGGEPQNVSDKFFIMKHHLVPYWKDIFDYIFRGNRRIYSYGESYYDLSFCIETSMVDDINHEEWAYTDKDFTWFIYFSHEDTVAFAGTITPVVKDILYAEKEHWDRYEYPEF